MYKKYFKKLIFFFEYINIVYRCRPWCRIPYKNDCEKQKNNTVNIGAFLLAGAFFLTHTVLSRNRKLDGVVPEPHPNICPEQELHKNNAAPQ
jgi:hypothetical protein